MFVRLLPGEGRDARVSWGRVDDRTCLDSRVGQLTDAEYRAREALLQFCLREYRDHGLFPAVAIIHAAYATPKGPKAVTRKQLARLRELGFVLTRDEYSSETLEKLGITWPETEHEWLRINAWEKYNPPRDKTAAERQRRKRQSEKADESHGDVTDTSRRDNRDGHTPSHAGTCASSVPSRPKQEPQATTSEHEPAAAGLHDLLNTLEVHGGLRTAAFQDPERATAWALKALGEATSSPGGMFRVGLESGFWPAAVKPAVVPVELCPGCGVASGRHAADCECVSSPDESESA